jgi:hypothetical protein
MNINDLVADVLARNLEFAKKTVADLSDADLMVRPAPGANHAMWQLGHLIVSEKGLISALKPGSMPELPAGFEQRFTPETCKSDDPNAFVKKSDLIDALTKVRSATIKWATGLTLKDMDQPTPERMRQWVPTVGHLATMLPVHVAMHIGQIQVLRRKLGKPILF